MSEDIYVEPDSIKKVRFQMGEKDDGNTNIYDDINSVRIYNNCWAEESTPRDKSQDKSWDNTTEDQQQMSSVNVSSGKRNRLGAAAVFLGLLCLLLLVAVIVLVVLLFSGRNQLCVDNVNLTRERDEMESLIHNLTQKMSQLENEKDYLNARVKDFNKTIDELQKQIETTWCPNYWTTFGKSCYLMSKTEKNWHNSKRDCENRDAHLVIISSKEEQIFISSFNRRVWIGLTDGETENTWKWVDGTTPATTYWRGGQPDDGNSILINEDCVEISTGPAMENWNDSQCSKELHFICEIMLK